VTRLEAAEKEVVRLAFALQKAERDVTMAAVLRQEYSRDAVNAAARDLSEALDRLRDLRERAKEEECGEMRRRTFAVRGGGDLFHANEPPVRCHLPRGHEGQHQGELGLWRWE